MAAIKKQKPQGFELWVRILKPEKNFYIVSFIYACAISLLSLAIPISVQALVNTVTFAVLKQPLIVVTLLLLSLLVFSGVLKGLQDYAIEFFQRHFFARATLEISQHMINAKEASLKSVYRGDLINRYFDIMTVQKAMAKLLVEGFALLLQTLVGMLLLAFYHPYFLAFDIVLATLLSMVWFFYGEKALESSVVESKAKYKVGAWLEQLTQSNKIFKSATGRKAAIERTNDMVNLYLHKRGIHFKYLFRQIIFLLGVYAFLSALILGLGGFLVMEGQLTLGQLVAAEIVVAVILSGFAKAGDYLEAGYDMHAALDKLADFTQIDTEKPSGITRFTEGNKDIVFENISLQKGNMLYQYNSTFHMGKSYLVTEDYDTTQRVFLQLIQGEYDPERGKILLGTQDISTLCPYHLRDRIIVIDHPTLIEGTIAENLTWGQGDVTDAQINEALDLVGLSELIQSLDKGVETLMWPESDLLSTGESIRLEIARAIIKKPDWVVISSIFHQIPRDFQASLLRAFKKKEIGLLVWSAGYGEKPEEFDEEIFFSRKSIGQ